MTILNRVSATWVGLARHHQLDDEASVKAAIFLDKIDRGLPERGGAPRDPVGRGLLIVFNHLVELVRAAPDITPGEKALIERGLSSLAGVLRAAADREAITAPRTTHQGVFAALIALGPAPSRSLPMSELESVWLSLRTLLMNGLLDEVNTLVQTNRSLHAQGDEGGGPAEGQLGPRDEGRARPSLRCYADQLGGFSRPISRLRARWSELRPEDVAVFRCIIDGGQPDPDWWNRFTEHEARAHGVASWADELRRLVFGRVRNPTSREQVERHGQRPVSAQPDPAGPVFHSKFARAALARVVVTPHGYASMITRGGRIDGLPARASLRALPGSALPLLIAALLGRDDALPGERTRLTLLVAFLFMAGVQVHPSRLTTLSVLRAGVTPAPDRDMQLDLESGILYVLPEKRLLGCLARTPADGPAWAVENVCCPVESLWPLPLPALLVGLLRSLADLFPGAATEGRLFMVDTREGEPRPLVPVDLVAAMHHWAPLLPGQYMPVPEDWLRLGVALAWLDRPGFCPALLPHLAGTYMAEFSVSIAYEAPTVKVRAQAATVLLDRVIAEIEERLGARFGEDDAIMSRFATLIAGARDRGAVPAPAPCIMEARTGSPRLLTNSHIATILARAVAGARRPTVAPLPALAARVATELTIHLSLRPSELRDLHRRDVGAPSPFGLWLRVRGKPKGDTRTRWRHVPVPGKIVTLLSQYLQRAGLEQRDTLFPSGVVETLIADLPYCGRHRLATDVLQLYTQLSWTPRQWVALQAAIGHDFAEHPFGRDDDGVQHDARIALEALFELRSASFVGTGQIPTTLVPKTSPPRRAAGSGPLAAIAEALRDGPLPITRVAPGRRVLVAHLIDRIARTRWPESEAKRQQRVYQWYRELVRMDANPQAVDARRLLYRTQELLRERGLLAGSVILPPPLAYDAPDAVAALAGMDDPLGLADLNSIVGKLATFPPTSDASHSGIELLAALAWQALRLECPWPDAAVALAAVRWRDHRILDRLVVLPPTAGSSPMTLPRYLVLGPQAQLAVLILRCHCVPDGADLMFPALPRADDLKLPSAGRHRAVISRRWREDLSGAAVAALIDGAPYRPLLDGNSSPIASYLAACLTEVPPARVLYDEDRRSETSSTRSNPPRPEAITIVDNLFKGVETFARKTATASLMAAMCEQLEFIIRGREVGAIGPVSSGSDNNIVVTAESPALDLLSEWATTVGDGEESTLFNWACALAFIIYRARRQKGPTWLGAPVSRRQNPAVGSLRTWLTQLSSVVGSMGTVALQRHTDATWLLDDDDEPATAALRSTVIHQWRRFLGQYVLTSSPAGWRVVVPPAQNRPYRLVEAAVIDDLFRTLADEGEAAEDLTLLAAGMLSYGARKREAGALRCCDIDGLGGCHIPRMAAKSGRARYSPIGYAPELAVAAIAKRCAHVDRRVGEEEPYLVPAAGDPGLLRARQSRLATVLREYGLHPHDLRHGYLTVRRAAAIACRDEPKKPWPLWVQRAAEELDTLRTGALAAGHRSTDTTGSTYDHCALLLAARAADRQAMRDTRPLFNRRTVRMLLHIAMDGSAKLILALAPREGVGPKSCPRLTLEQVLRVARARCLAKTFPR